MSEILYSVDSNIKKNHFSENSTGIHHYELLRKHTSNKKL